MTDEEREQLREARQRADIQARTIESQGRMIDLLSARLDRRDVQITALEQANRDIEQRLWVLETRRDDEDQE